MRSLALIGLISTIMEVYDARMSSPQPIDDRIGARIRDLRAERGLTLDGLARLAEVTARRCRASNAANQPHRAAARQDLRRSRRHALRPLCRSRGAGEPACAPRRPADLAGPGEPISPASRLAAGHFLAGRIVEIVFPPGSAWGSTVSGSMVRTSMSGARRHARCRSPATRFSGSNGRLSADAVRSADRFQQPDGAFRSLRRSSATEPRGHDPICDDPRARRARSRGRLGELADILLDAVAHGASVNFMAEFSAEDGRAFLARANSRHHRAGEAACRRR